MENRGLKLIEKDGVKYYSSTVVEANKFPHFFSTRIGGVSEDYYSSLNLGIYTDDNKESVKENFRRIFDSSGMGLNRIVYLKQVHGDKIYVVDDSNYKEVCGSYGDALITKSRGIAIGVFTADCVPILIADPSTNTVAAVHAGWKGTNLQIVVKVLNHLIREMHCNPEKIRVLLGPSIGPCCFEVKSDVADKFTYVDNREGNLYVDLWKENYSQIIQIGIPQKNIISGELCTMCDNEMFFSYRREKGFTGRLGSFIQISKEG